MRLRMLSKRLLVTLMRPVWRALSWLIPKDAHLIAVSSYPDFDDTVRSLQEALRGTDRMLHVLTTRGAPKVPSWIDPQLTRYTHQYSLGGIWTYHRARVVVFTHGCFSSWLPSSRQTIVNVWHGVPLKRIGRYDGEPPWRLQKSHFLIAPDEPYRNVMAHAFNLSPGQVLLLNHPRTDVLMFDARRARSYFGSPAKLAVWLPTFRAASTEDNRTDGDPTSSVFSTDLSQVNALFARHESVCVMKPHPMARQDPSDGTRYTALRRITDDDLVDAGLSLYELLAAADFLITDVSSVYFDYRLLRRPVLLYCPDLGTYSRTRGFVAPIESLVADPILSDPLALQEAIDRLLREPGSFPPNPAYHRAGGAGWELLRRVNAV